MRIMLLVGGRAYTLPAESAIDLRDRIREHASDDRTLGNLADAIDEELAQREPTEPIDLGTPQIEALSDILFGASADEPLERLRVACERFVIP